AEESRQDILFSAAQIYYGAASLKQLITVQQRNLEIALDHERDAKVRYDAGTVPKVSLLRAQIDRSRAEQDLKRALNSYEESKVSLATLLGRDRAEFEVDIPAQPQLPADLGALHGDALRLRPDVLASREQVTVAERTRDGTIASYLPTVSAFARYDYLNTEGFTGRTTFWTIGLQASWTILDGFLRESDLRENQSKVREAAAARESTALKASEEVERARLDLDSATANRDKAKEQLDLARENQRLVNVNFKAGAATYIEVADANLELLRAAQTLVGETLNADLAALRLIKASGHFNPT
ncbi:MAG TPA: TolC family protein, partial [Anaeromyxobacteraceae bacterium]|nr:TolC family protein [Anaeromyxobacteraceae bacterium]